MSLESLSVKRLVVRDEKGKVRIMLGVDGKSGGPGVFLMNKDENKIAGFYIEVDDLPSLVMGTGGGGGFQSDMLELSVDSPQSARLQFRSPLSSGDGTGLVLSMGSIPPGLRTVSNLNVQAEATLKGFMSIWDANGKAIVDYQ
jgi:hypothetical protein